MRQRVAYARQLVAEGHSPSALARILQISRQAIYRVPATPPAAARRSRQPVDDVERAIVQVAQANPTDGYRIVTAWVQRKLGRAVNRKRVLRVMRERKLIQRRIHEPHRRRPGFFKVERPGQIWHLDMTSIWVAEHGWVYLNAIIDCCTREIVGWELSLRCRAKEAITVIERAVAEQGILPGTLTLGTDNGELYPDVVDACDEDGGVPSRLIKTDRREAGKEGTPCQMFAGSPSGRRIRVRSRLMISLVRARVA